MEQFKGLFKLLFPWANGAQSDPLALRFFRMLDQNGDALINFREFISGLGKKREVVCASLQTVFRSNSFNETNDSSHKKDHASIS